MWSHIYPPNKQPKMLPRGRKDTTSPFCTLDRLKRSSSNGSAPVTYHINSKHCIDTAISEKRDKENT